MLAIMIGKDIYIMLAAGVSFFHLLFICGRYLGRCLRGLVLVTLVSHRLIGFGVFSPNFFLGRAR